MIANEIADAAGIDEILARYCTFWKGTGRNLGLSESVLDVIEEDNKEQRKCFEMTLKMWLWQDQEKATWGVLELAITNSIRAKLSLEKLMKCELLMCDQIMVLLILYIDVL